MFIEYRIITSNEVSIMRILLNSNIISSSVSSPISDHREKSIDIEKANCLRILIEFIGYILISCHSPCIFLIFIELA